MRFVVVVVREYGYILLASVREAVGGVHRSRVTKCYFGYFGVEGSLGYGVLFFLGVFGMSVETAVYFIGAGVLFTGAVSSNWNFR
jgi:hypothetical protein